MKDYTPKIAYDPRKDPNIDFKYETGGTKNFFERLENSRPSIGLAAAWAEQQDFFDIEVPDISMRPNVAQRFSYSDKGDIIASKHWQGSTYRVVIEVKHRNSARFTSMDNFRFPSIFVDTVKKWERKPVKPYCYINFNHDLTAAIFVFHCFRGMWYAEYARDGDTKYRDLFYYCPVVYEACRFYRVPQDLRERLHIDEKLKAISAEKRQWRQRNA